MPTTTYDQQARPGSGGFGLNAQAGVLVLGGGPAGGWAAIAAAEAGQSVILVDKGYFGTSGATAPSNTGTWCIPPGDARRSAVERRAARTGGLSTPRRALQVLDASYEGLKLLLERGYPFPTDETGKPYIANLRGPDYMRFLRRLAQKAGVRIFDHHPALELLSHADGIGGAAGIDRRNRQPWRIEAGAVVLATGGCAFAERILGAAGLTGDGYLMAAEVGASLSGMEFTGQYGLAPAGTSLNKGLVYRWASYFDADGQQLDDEGDRHVVVAKALLKGPVFARLDKATPDVQDWLRRGQPNIMLPFDRDGIDPFKQTFELALRSEGTIRGIGGIRLASDDGSTGVPGLYAAGDTASREDLTGAITGGGGPNASWAIASGRWAGAAAAAHSRRMSVRAGRKLTRRGGAGLRFASAVGVSDVIVRVVREEMLPIDRGFFRTGAVMEAGLTRLDALWSDRGDAPDASATLKAREAAALLATARWSLTASLRRPETRGIHRRTDHVSQDPSFEHRIVLTGVNCIDVTTDASFHAEQVLAS